MPILNFDRPVWFPGHKAHRGPLYVNRTAGRFAAPGGEFGTLYLGQDEFCSLIEAFTQEVLGHGPFGPIVSRGRLERCCLCQVVATRTIRLVDLTNGPALCRLSPEADNRINDGPHVGSQRGVLAFEAHPSQPDGLLSRSRLAPEWLSPALFDRVSPDLTANNENLLNDPERLATMLDYIGCALIP